MKPFPLFFARSEGSRLWDADGNEYIDYALGMGPVILGHAHPVVNAAVAESLARGQIYAGQHEGELTLVRKIHEIVPSAERVRLSLSGSEAVQAALRVARAFTGRTKVIKFEGHYHGWFDNVFVSVSANNDSQRSRHRRAGVPMSRGQVAGAYADMVVLSWNDLEALEQTLSRGAGEFSAIIMEPILGNTSVIPPCPGFMEKVRELCTQNGILLVFDEVITGFRVGLGGAQEHLHVKPDLSVFAKSLANGYPLSCLAGRADVMELFASGGAVHAGTYNGNCVGCAAGLATLCALEADDRAAYCRINQVGTLLIEGMKALARETGRPLHVQGLPAMFHTTFTEEKEITNAQGYRRSRLDLQNQFVVRLQEQGIRLTNRGTWFLSAAHTPRDADLTLKAVRDVLHSLP